MHFFKFDNLIDVDKLKNKLELKFIPIGRTLNFFCKSRFDITLFDFGVALF